MKNVNRVIIAGTHSGCGKTLVTHALLECLKAQKLDVCAFKCGPDYLDTAFHRNLQNIDSYNLDSIFSSPEQLKSQLYNHSDKDISVIEGVMGYFDGVGEALSGSTYNISKIIDTPVILVVNARGMYQSVIPLVKGFMDYKESNIKGVILNRVSKSYYSNLKSLIEKEGIKVFGYIEENESFNFESRYLGLITPLENEELKDKLSKLRESASNTLDLDAIINHASTASTIECNQKKTKKEKKNLRVAIAKDRAFSFIYSENVDMLEENGCEIVYFSPMSDKELPPNIDALYLVGGYPELYLRELSSNTKMLEDVKNKIESGLPTIAECGGFLYLHKTLDNEKMANVIPYSANKTKTLQNFGYSTLQATSDGIIMDEGDVIKAHEYHTYVSSGKFGDIIVEKMRSKKRYEDVIHTKSLYAGFPHLYFPSNPSIVDHFIKAMINYRDTKKD